MNLSDFSRVLALAVRHPDLEHAEVLLGRDSNSVDLGLDLRVCQRLANKGIGQVLPGRNDLSRGNPVREAATSSIPGIFPCRLYAFPHEEQHAVLY